MTGVETAGSAHPWGDDGEGSDPDSHADLDGDDAIIVTQNEEGDATPASPDPHVTQAPTTPAAVDDDVIVLAASLVQRGILTRALVSSS